MAEAEAAEVRTNHGLPSVYTASEIWNNNGYQRLQKWETSALVCCSGPIQSSQSVAPAKRWQLGRGECHCFQIKRDNRCKKSLALQTHPFLVIPFHNQIGWYSCTANLTGIKLESRLNMTPLLRSGKIWAWKVLNQLSNFIFNNSYASEENIH